MKKKEPQTIDGDFSITFPTSLDLRGKQSVRATFKLTERAINALSIVSAHLGIKQKSLFDHLIDDVHSLTMIAKEIESDTFYKLDRIQKTYVVSRKTLVCLGETAQRFDAPRDALVEYSIQRLLPIIKEERAKHRKRKEILQELMDFIDQGEQLLKRAKDLLGEEDPVFHKIASVMNVNRNARENISDYVERGEIIENF